MHEHPHVDLVVSLLHDHLAHAVLSWAKHDAKLGLTYIPFTEAEGVTQTLPPPVRAVGLACHDPADAGTGPIC
jgi:hypothetical protein